MNESLSAQIKLNVWMCVAACSIVRRDEVVVYEPLEICIGWVQTVRIAKNSFPGKHAAMMVAYLPANKSKPRRVAAQGPLCPCATNALVNARQGRRFAQAALRACGWFE
jgi:hypothetical protein